MTPPTELQRGLKQRHLTMIAIGGVIGAGLFVGSGVVINQTGPAAFLSYAITGVLIILVMRMLGEMATANPSTGSFADYARRALGGWAGFSVAWLYWYFWVIVVGFEAVAGAKILTFWIDAPLWILSLVLMLLMTATNLVSVGSYGEFEYWFAGIKVFAIIAFLVLGTLYVLGLWPDQSFDVSNLTSHGGFLPNGVGAIFSSIVVVVFSMVGAEIATVAAAESHDPEKAIAKATQSVIFRVATFFVGSMILLVCIVPWNDNDLGDSPYVAAFEEMGIPYADQIMNAVVLTAVLSCLNSGLYTASRMLFVLAARREAPMRLITVNKRGVPVWAILSSTVVGFLSVIAAYVSPDTVFLFLLNSSGAVILFVYLLIAVSQYVLRRRTPDEDLKVKMWFFPVLTIAAGIGIVAVLLQMGLKSDTRSQLLLSLLSWAVVVGPLLRDPLAGRLGVPRGARVHRRRTRTRAEDRRAGQPDDGRERAARRARADRGQRPGQLLRGRAGQPGRHGAGRSRGCGIRVAGHHRGRAATSRPDAGGAALPRALGRGRARGLPPAGGPGQGRYERVRAGPRGDRHPARGAFHLASARRRRRRPTALGTHDPARRGARSSGDLVTQQSA